MASIKQYKTLFKRMGWKKNIKAQQWRALGSVLTKRKSENKETDILLDGRTLDAKTLKRELGRHCDGVTVVPNASRMTPASFRVLARDTCVQP